jgi:hypothetical protein
MKKVLIPTIALLIGAAACSDELSLMAPAGPQFELTDPYAIVSRVDAMVSGSFSIPVYDTPAGGGNPSGRVADNRTHVPDHARGECEDGVWYNPQGRKTSGSSERPHPHCVGLITEPGDPVLVRTIILEPISVKINSSTSNNNYQVYFAESIKIGEESVDTLKVQQRHTQNDVVGVGTMEAWAVDMATDVKVGRVTINLSTQYTQNGLLVALPADCGDFGVFSKCFNKTVVFAYTPEPGVQDAGTAGNVSGVLFWKYEP